MGKSRLEEGAEQQVLARQDRDDFNELPRCRNPWKINSSGDTESKGDFRLKQLLLLCAFLGLSVIPMILGRAWIQDELSFVFKCKTMGRVTRIEQQEKVSISRRRYRTRRYIKEIEHYVYTVDGRRYNGTSTLRWTKKKSEGNTRVPIYYDGDKPSESRLLTVWWVWTKVCIAGLLMWLFFFACMTTVHDIVEGREIKTEDGTLVIRIILGDVEYWPDISIVEPNVVVTTEADWDGCHPSGTVGQSTLVTENYIGPMNVSFQGVMVAEIPCYDEIQPTGYFATGTYQSFGFLSHTTNAGAGTSRRIQTGNRWTTDRAGGGAYPNWESGRLEWKVPIGWVRIPSDAQAFGTVSSVQYELCNDQDSRPLLIGNRTDKYMQIMTIDEDGAARIEKFGHWLSRGRYCRIILDGVTKQWNHWF